MDLEEKRGCRALGPCSTLWPDNEVLDIEPVCRFGRQPFRFEQFDRLSKLQARRAQLQWSCITFGKVQAEDLGGRVHPSRRVGQDLTVDTPAYAKPVDLSVAAHDGSPRAFTGTCAPDTYRPRLGNSEHELVVREPRKRLAIEAERDRPIEPWDQLLHLAEPVRPNDEQPGVARSQLLRSQEPPEGNAAAIG